MMEDADAPATRADFESLATELRAFTRTMSAAFADRGASGNSIQVTVPPPDAGERSALRTEKNFTAMVVLNVCMGAMLVLNWITDTNQTHVINAIYMMAPGLQKQIEAKKEMQP
jgi:hypothetical protein